MIPTASVVIRGSGQTIATPTPAELLQSEFADTLGQYLAGTRAKDIGTDSAVADPKATLTQRCKALTALINQRLAEGDNALGDDELQNLQALLAQLALQQWPADGDSVLAKLGINPGHARPQSDGAALAEPRAGGQRGEESSSLTAVAPEFPDAQGRKEHQPLLLVPPARRNARRAENALPRLESVNGQAQAALPRARGERPLRAASRVDSLAATSAQAPAVPPYAGLDAITTDPSLQRVQTSPPVPIAHLRQPLGSPAWQQQLGEHITLFNRKGVFHAQLHLHPRELGAVKVNLRLNNKEQLQVHFASDNQQVRAVLETAVTQLRTSLAENGIALGNISVGTEASGHDASGQQQGHGDSPPHDQARGKSLFVAHRNGSVSAGGGAWYRDGIDIYA